MKLLAVSLFSFFLIAPVRAWAIMPQPPETPPLDILGQDHYYSVTFRGNGEAITTLKIILTNLADQQPLSQVTLRVPRVDPKEITVYQVLRERQCVIYKSIMPESQSKAIPDYQPKPPECEQYQEPDYYQYWYGNVKYQKAAFILRGDTIIIELPNKIKPDTTGSFIVYFRAVGYAKKNLLGVYNFVFETLKVEDKIHTLQVGINTDADLYLRGAKGTVNYRFEEGISAMKSTSGETVAVANSQFDTFYQQIGQGSIVKNASNLQSLDSYTVKGSFADSISKLYVKEISVGLIVTVFLLVLLVYLARYILRKLRNSTAQVQKRPIDNLLILEVLGLSFIASFLILSYTLFVFFISRYLNSYGYYEFNTLLLIFLIVVSVFVYGILFFGPAIFVGVRKNFGAGLSTLFLTVLLLIFYVVVISLVLFLLSQSRRYPPPYPIPSQIEKTPESSSMESK